ncbi:MAG: hypothetical protein SCH66_12025 [Methanolobus sp.]|nr:hypothetical protein [Methanolobus sp.]
MPLMSIIGCEMFAQEVSQLLGKDGDIERLIVINEKKSDIVKQLQDLGAEYEELSPDMLPAGLKRNKGLCVIVDLQSVSLHIDRFRIKKETYEKIKFYGKVSNGVLLLYGVHNEAFADVLSDFERARFHLVALKGDGSMMSESGIDDCTTGRIDEGLLSPHVLAAYKESYRLLKKKLLDKKK